jgi:hypothetical protein
MHGSWDQDGGGGLGDFGAAVLIIGWAVGMIAIFCEYPSFTTFAFIVGPIAVPTALPMYRGIREWWSNRKDRQQEREHMERQGYVRGPGGCGWRMPVDTQAKLLAPESAALAPQAGQLAPASTALASSPECIIKGNVNRQGERIYHLPGQKTYAAINMKDPQKRWFCSEDDARAAGWRPTKR